jgi:transcriptional regulator with PAS, ATPase and Fis domain
MTTETKIHKTKMMLREEARLGKLLEDVIPEAYERLGNLEAVGMELGIKSNTLYIWMLRLGITARKVTIVER